MTFIYDQSYALVDQSKKAFSDVKDDSLIAIQDAINVCEKNRQEVNRLLQIEHLAGGTEKHLMWCIDQIKSYLAKLRQQSVGEGSSIQKGIAANHVKWEDIKSAFRDRISTGVIVNLDHKDVAAFLEDALVLFQRRIKDGLKIDEAFKVHTAFCGKFRMKEDEELDFKRIYTKTAEIYRDTDINKWFTTHVKQPIMAELEELQERGSGWKLSSIVSLTITINKFVRPLGSSFIELPSFIKKKKACINVRNNDDACFAWAVMSCLYPTDPKQNPCRTSSYPNYATKLKLDNITMPMTKKQIPRFEKQNDVSINVYILKKISKDKFRTTICYLTKAKKDKHVNLLLIQDKYDDDDDDYDDDDDDDDHASDGDMVISVKYHYVWIKSLSRLVSNQLNKNEHRKYICDRCLNYFHRRTHLNRHTEVCTKINNCEIVMPIENHNTIEFKHFSNKIKVPFIIYADLECILEPCNNRNKYEEHIACSIGYYVKCSYDDSKSVYKSHRGKDCVKWFSAELKQFAQDTEPLFLHARSMNKLTSTEKQQYLIAKTCHICEKPFKGLADKVMDHCHFTGNYRGPAHNKCNINFRDSYVVPVVFHNLSGYDSHFIIKKLDFKGRIDLIPKSKEKYISFTKHVHENLIKFRFIDSFRFMSSSLDKLASNLKTYPILKSEFLELPDEEFQLLTRKGVYPYEYFDSFERFAETELPSIEKFHTKLNDVKVSDHDYARAQLIYTKFKIKDLGEYSDLYLKTDVLLLADIFEQFRSTLLESHKLDPAHYYSAPGYTWDAMLKYTEVKLKLLTDIDMLLFVEQGVRGGLSQCSKRYVKANNKYMDDYDSSQPSTYLLYTDVNNLYGWAMSQPLPCADFAWVENVEGFNIKNIPDDSSEGYILEVDLHYPPNVHDAHSDLPFCCEHRASKLMATLYDKVNYIIHYKNLKQVLANGLELVKIHRILKFQQSAWLKPYIDLNTSLRTNAENEFEKDLYKLLNNAVFGKTMENVRKYGTVKLATKWDGRYGAERLIAKPEFKSSVIFDENLVAIELNKTEIYFNKPIYVGMCILDISKTKVYEFHYEYMKPQFGNKCRVCYTDTDSLIYEVKCNDIYEVIRNDCHRYFDTSDYPENNKYCIPRENKKVPGMMKDELNGKIMTEFVGLRSKCYAYRVEGKDKDKKAKGVKTNVKNKITFQDYFECLKDFKHKSVQQNLIRSEKHDVFTITQQKIALSPNDDKRYLKSDSYDTLAWGHYEIMETS